VLKKCKTRLLKFSNGIYVSGTRPEEWISAVILPVYKKGLRWSRGSVLAEAVGFLRAKKSSAPLPSEGK
jgi:hypothetical protein